MAKKKKRDSDAFDGFALDHEDEAPILHAPKRVSLGVMAATNAGGSLERVEGFDAYRARNEGLPFFPATHAEPVTPAYAIVEHENGDDDFRPENVFLPDQRAPIRDTSAIPWRSIALLNITYQDGYRAIGTAWFIGPRAMATAAHNLHDKTHGRAATIQTFPAFDGRTAPFGSVGVERVFYPAAWTSNWAQADDYGVLILTSAAMGKRLGWFGLAEFDPAPAHMLANVCGYAEDRAPRTQYFNGGRLQRWTASFIEYPFDTSPGMSGGPLFYKSGEDRIAIGIHAYGGSRLNRARRIKGVAFDKLQEYSRLGQ